MDVDRVLIRPATEEDLIHLGPVERAAGELFRSVGMATIADDPPPTPAALRVHLRAGGLLVAAAPGAAPVGYLALGVLDGRAHVHQVTVHPRAGQRGVGRRLMTAAVDWARERGLPAVTPTTFAEVPWNGPWYASQGFVVLDEAGLGPDLRATILAEVAHGLAAAGRRVVMGRPVTGSPPGTDESTTVHAMPDPATLAHDVRLATTRLVRRLRQEQPMTELTLSQISALATVAADGPMTAGELATREQVRPPTVTRLVDRLVAVGLVNRRGNPDDGRKVLIEISETGRERIEEIIRVREQWLTGRMADLTDQERDVLAQAVAILDRVTER